VLLHKPEMLNYCFRKLRSMLTTVHRKALHDFGNSRVSEGPAQVASGYM